MRDDRDAAELTLIANLHERHDHLRALFEENSGHWGFEDPVYRFYHQSWKIYGLQQQTEAIVTALAALVPNRSLNEQFLSIVACGTGRTFAVEDNRRWTEATRPILEAFFHARYFLEMATRYGGLDTPPNPLPSGYAALLYLYGLR